MNQTTLFKLHGEPGMDHRQITDRLNALFEEGPARIVFWNDPEGEFEDVVRGMSLAGVTVVFPNQMSALALKKRLEMDDPDGRYLIYAPEAEPAPEEDWLLDIRLYSPTFRADRASIISSELGLISRSLHPYISSRKLFFSNQERLHKLKKWVTPTDNENDLELKILTVLTKAGQPEFFAVCMSLFSAFCQDGDFKPNVIPPMWEEIEKFGLASTFWELAARIFGYAPEKPKLTDLMIRLLVTDFAIHLQAGLPPSLSHFKLEPEQLAGNAAVFISQWRSHMAYFLSFNAMAGHYERHLKIWEAIHTLDLDHLLEVMTFEAVEKAFILEIRDRIPGILNPNDFDELSALINHRLNGYWAGHMLRLAGIHNAPSLQSFQDKVNLYRSAYLALFRAIGLFQLRLQFETGFNYATPESMFTAYKTDLYLFDKNYRHFHYEADQVELGGWDVLKGLRDKVEDCYSGWFMDQLSLAWGGFMKAEDGPGLMDTWQLAGVKRQSSFYNDFVKGVLETSSRSRVFVIVSDAFRYEAAEELTGDINGKYRLKAELEAMLGVLPSYTGLGMAALLPHRSIAYTDHGDILVNGKPAAGLEQRGAVLAEYQGVAVRADELLAMNKQQGRDFVKPYRLVYVYHNRIDAVGDKLASEHKTFEAVQQAIREVDALVSFMINGLNAGYVVVTADHGFIYQEKFPEAADKSVLDAKPAGAAISKKRYIVGPNLGAADKAWSGLTKVSAGTDPGLEFWVPKGANRFHFTGGSRFIHGGAMLQEIMVPVVVVRELRGREREQSTIRRVGVSLLGSNKKIVTNRHRFEFIQTEAVSDRVQARTLSISLRDRTELISNEETVTFDSTSPSMDDRKKSVMMTLKARDYDHKTEYSLVLRDPEDGIEYERMAVHIDLAFRDEFSGGLT